MSTNTNANTSQQDVLLFLETCPVPLVCHIRSLVTQLTDMNI